MLNVRVPEEEFDLRPRITVIGVGGAGSNATNNMIRSELQGVEFLVCNTDAQSLKMSLSERKIQLGNHVTRGLGAGANPKVGAAAAEEALEEIMGYLEGSNMVFITAGMGGGTGTGAASVIARAAKELGILTVGVVTKPFHFEGAHRMRLADAGIEELQQHVDTLLIIPNQNLFRVANEKTTFADAFKMADEVLHAGVRGVTDLMVMPGLINLDFADIRAVMSEMGKAMMGTGEATGERRAIEAAEAAINNPLLEDASMQGARGLLINITGGMDMTLYEVDEACNRIRDEVDPDANIIFGSTFNPELDGKIRVSVVATGIDSAQKARQTTGQGQTMPHGYTNAPTFQAPQQQQQDTGFNAALQRPSVVTGNAFNRAANALRGTAAVANAPVAPQQQHVAQQRTGTTGTTSARANTAMNNPSPNSGNFYGRGNAGAATARRMEEEFAPLTVGALEADTAEEFLAAENYAVETEIAPVATQQTRQQVQQQQQRGERDGDSFIPPMPMMTDAKPVATTSAPQQPQQRTNDIFAEANPTQNYQPAAPQQQAQYQQPVQQQQQQAQQTQQAEAKRPGLFDRLTGAARPQQQPPQMTAAPSLAVDNSDRMSQQGSFDEDLDIPAFLRRQMN